MEEDRIEREGRSLYDQSILVVNVIEAQGVEFPHSSVSLTVGDKTYITNSNEGQTPQFNVQFTFNGSQLKDQINVVLNDNTDTASTMNGHYPISELLDQKIHDRWVLVRPPKPTSTETKVHLQFKYTYSKSRLCAEAIENWRQHISSLQQKNENSLNDLRQMYQEFDFLETIKQKPNYFADIRPIDKIGYEVNSTGNHRTEIRSSSSETVTSYFLHSILCCLFIDDCHSSWT